ncbi:MAG: RNA-dependent RNA polymerase [Sanya narnavirus 5]|nr:MAG: RNA-dependent RNA polymerase [Sanya narnavirus 5]
MQKKFSLPLNPFSWPCTPGVVGAGSWIKIPRPATMESEQRKFISQVWRAVRTNIDSVLKGPIANIVPIKLFVRWVIACSNTDHGRLFVSKEIKRVCFLYRTWAVSGRYELSLQESCSIPKSFLKWLKGCSGTPTKRAQIARIGRCLPEGDMLVIRRAVKDHMRIVRGRSDVNLELADQIYEFAYEFCRARRNKIRSSVSIHPNEEVASFFYDSTEGGRMRELADNAWKWHAKRPVPVGFGYHTKAQTDELILDAAIHEDGSHSILRGKVHAVPERGYKARTVVTLPATSLLISDVIRRQIFPMFEDERDLDFDRLIRADKFEDFIKQSLHASGIVVSSDLSNATDYVPHLYSDALWQGIFAAIDAPSWCLDHVRKIMGPIEAIYPNGRMVTTTRGIQMGTPLSFLTLSLLHKFAVVRSKNGGCPHLIRGDDLIGILRYPRAYLACMEEVGFKINRAKTIISRQGGVFAEQTINVEWRESSISPRKIRLSDKIFGKEMEVSSVKLLNDIPFAGLLHPSNGRQMQIRNIGRWFSQWAPTFPQRAWKIAHRQIMSNYKMLVVRAMKAGVPVHSIVELGGAGIPKKSGFVGLIGPFWYRQVVGYAASHRSTEFSRWVRSLDIVERGVYWDAFEEEIRKIPLSQRAPTFEPETDESFLAFKRRTFMRNRLSKLILRPATLSGYIGGLKSLFNRGMIVSARWTPPIRKGFNINSPFESSGKIHTLVRRIKMMGSTYVPVTPLLPGFIQVKGSATVG